jgi:ArsR family transcriptional regulator
VIADVRKQQGSIEGGGAPAPRPRRDHVPVTGLRRPLYQMKADFFKTLGHPARIRVLELLAERDHAVSEMLPDIDIEPANLSQQLSILRRAGLVTARREGLSVTYTLTSPRVAELLAVARAILTGVVAGQAELLETAIDTPPEVPAEASI